MNLLDRAREFFAADQGCGETLDICYSCHRSIPMGDLNAVLYKPPIHPHLVPGSSQQLAHVKLVCSSCIEKYPKLFARRNPPHLKKRKKK